MAVVDPGVRGIDGDLAALLLRLFGTHLQVHSDRIMKAMIFERLDAVELAP